MGTFTAVTTSGTDYKVAFSTGAVLATLSLDSPGAIDKLLFHDETSPVDRKALDRLFSSKEPLADWFTPAFLSQVSLAELGAGLQQIATQEGAFERIELRDGAYYAVYAKAMNHVNVMTDGQGRITYLFIQAPVANTVSLNDALPKLTSGSGSVSYVILKGDRQIAAHFADRPEAVGSAFKLVVLAALRSQIDAKRHGWTDVVALPAADKSLPSGTFQAWPDNTPITLATYAAQMISISDNTASDAGVLNFTSYLTAPGGATYCVSATWNDRAHPIDEASRVAAYGAVLKQLSNR